VSDDRIQIHIPKKPGEPARPGKTLNYAEFGKFAQLNGTVRSEMEACSQWPKFEKRVQEIRLVLRNHFGMSSDPIPYVEGTGYRTLFKISCAPSFHR